MNEIVDLVSVPSHLLLTKISWLLIHSIWQFSAVAMLAAFAARVLGHRNSSARYWCFVVGLALCLIVSACTWHTIGDAAAPTSMSLPESKLALPNTSPDGELVVVGERPAISSIEAESRSETLASAGDQSGFGPQRIYQFIVAFWGLGVLLFAARPLIGWWTIATLRRTGTCNVAQEVQRLLSSASSKLAVKRRVRVLQSSIAQVPMVVGYFRPVILLPASVVSSVPVAQLEAILAHELAHIRRHDFLINVVQIVAETICFYHPAVWWLSKQIRVEREYCCDDLVVKAFGNRQDYGKALVAIAELCSVPVASANSLTLAATGGPLLRRMQRLAGLPVDRCRFSAMTSAMLAAGLLAVIFAVVILQQPGWADEREGDSQSLFGIQVVDSGTGKPIPDGITLQFLFELKKDGVDPEVIGNFVWGPNAKGDAIDFRVPKAVAEHPRVNEIQVRWGARHDDYEELGARQSLALSELVQDTPKTARETLKKIELTRKLPKQLDPNSNEYIHRITIHGTATDHKGKPVSGAEVHLLDLEKYRPVAKAMTDADGKYVFKETPMTIIRAEPNTGMVDSTRFEIVALADGHGIACRPRKTFYAVNEAEDGNTYMGKVNDEPRAFYADQDIELDLKFSESKSVRGRVLDEQGKPIANAGVTMRFCQRIHDKIADGTVGSATTVEIESMNNRDLLPGSVKYRATDADGRFQFNDMPEGCFFWFSVRHGNYASTRGWAATTETPLPKLGGKTEIHIGEVRVVLQSKQPVTFVVLHGDTLQPAAGCFVNPHGGGTGTTDQDGRVTMSIPSKDNYDVTLLPAVDTPYLRTTTRKAFSFSKELAAAKNGQEIAIALSLDPAAVVDVMIVDAETGEPLPDADLWLDSREDPTPKQDASRSELMFRGWDPPIARVLRPVSDKDGKLRVLLPPGRQRIGVGYQRWLKGYKSDHVGQLIDCTIGEPTTVIFRMKKAKAK